MEEAKDTSTPKMWAIVLEKPAKPVLRRVDMPVPRSGQVLVRVEAAPINPSDLGNMNTDELPCPRRAGLEGSGVVVKSGGGLAARMLVNKRVAFARGGGPDTGSNSGTYAQYIVVDAMTVISLDKKIDFDHACSSFVNPLSAIGLLDTLKQDKAKFVVQTGAASQLARMMFRLAKDYGITFINIVRREEQVAMLKEEFKQEYVLNSSDESFFTDLR